MISHRIANALIGKELNLGINRQLDVMAIHRRDGFADILDDPAQAVTHHRSRSTASLQVFLKRQLNAFLAPLFDIGETDHMGCGLAFRILALVFPILEYAFQPQGLDLRRCRIVGLAPQPGKPCRWVQPMLELGRAPTEDLAQRQPLLGVGIYFLGDRPD